MLLQSEYLALYDLYNSTIGSNWHWQDTTENGAIWDFTGASDPCVDLWQGVTCQTDTNEVDHVVKLTLEKHGLRGRLPLSLGDFGES